MASIASLEAAPDWDPIHGLSTSQVREGDMTSAAAIPNVSLNDENTIRPRYRRR